MYTSNNCIDTDWFSIIAASCELSRNVASDLDEKGFVVIPGLLPADHVEKVAAAYDAAVSRADASDVSIGSTTTRVNDFVNRGAEFDPLYVYPAVLGACCSVIGKPFKLSTLHARAVHPLARAQELHVDYDRKVNCGSMVGIIVMIDAFRKGNGATRFVPGSHKWATLAGNTLGDSAIDEKQSVLACGPAGSVIIYDGSIWHGHSANQTVNPRRSIQGAYIPREATAAFNQRASLSQETLRRLDARAKYVLAV